MVKKKNLVDEFWEVASPPVSTEDMLKEFFDEFADLVNPKTYGADGILKSLIKLFINLAK